MKKNKNVKKNQEYLKKKKKTLKRNKEKIEIKKITLDEARSLKQEVAGVYTGSSRLLESKR